MCGRFALHSDPRVIALQFALERLPALPPARYNIAPTANVLVVRAGTAAPREGTLVRWGLVPRWAKDAKMGARMNNARAETVAQKPSFREAYRRRRCLVVADGFYEWQPVDGRKLPWYVTPANEPLFAFAGLWESRKGAEGPLETCCILTTQANAAMAPIHERMPVMVFPQDYARWLDCGEGHDVADLLVPCAPQAIRTRRVGTAVNRAANDVPELIEPLAD